MFKNIVFILITIISLNVFGQSNDATWKEENKVFTKVFDANLSSNQNTTIYQIAQENPIVLALVFTRCTGVCNPFLLQLKDRLAQLNGKDDFTVLVVSFDPKDTKADMENMAHRFGLEDNNKWIFAINENISQLNKSIGFNPIWDANKQQFDHDALLVGINSEGYMTKKLLGLRNEADLAQLIASINNVFAPTYRMPTKNMLFSCFNYNAATGKNTPGLGLLFIALPAVITLIILLSINYFESSKRG